jgi:hypothetical protein
MTFESYWLLVTIVMLVPVSFWLSHNSKTTPLPERKSQCILLHVKSLAESVGQNWLKNWSFQHTHTTMTFGNIPFIVQSAKRDSIWIQVKVWKLQYNINLVYRLTLIPYFSEIRTRCGQLKHHNFSNFEMYIWN